MTRVVDVSNSASFEDVAVMKFFEASTRNLLAQEAAAGVRHHLALSDFQTNFFWQRSLSQPSMKHLKVENNHRGAFRICA
jgi:hypothetical protein